MLAWQQLSWKQRALALSLVPLIALMMSYDPFSHQWQNPIFHGGLLPILIMIGVVLDPRTFRVVSRDQPMPRASLYFFAAAMGAGLGQLVQHFQDQKEFWTMVEMCNKVIGPH
jgi:hypothetical protein